MTARIGELRHRITFQKYSLEDDGYGGQTQTWIDAGTVFAKFHYLKGGEEVMAARLQAKQPAIITVRSDGVSRQADPTWRIRDADNALWNIRAITDPTGRRAWLEILAEKGVP